MAEGSRSGETNEKMAPTFTVIIPTRNRPSSLVSCLTHLHEDAVQTTYPIEVVVVDTSASPRADVVAFSDQWMRVVYQYDGDIAFSMVRSRNRGLEIACGDIVAFLDDDCFVRPGWIAQITAPYDDAKVVAVGGRIIYHPWSSPPVGGPVAVLDPTTANIWAKWDTIVEDGPVPVPHLPGGNCSFRRSAAFEIGGFDVSYGGSSNMEETDFFWRLGLHGGVLLFNSAAVVEHRAEPRVDGVARSAHNFIYRQSAVRNRLYFLRKTGNRRGVARDLRRQALDTCVGTFLILRDAMTFLVASVAGLILGMIATRKGPALRATAMARGHQARLRTTSVRLRDSGGSSSPADNAHAPVNTRI